MYAFETKTYLNDGNGESKNVPIFELILREYSVYVFRDFYKLTFPTRNSSRINFQLHIMEKFVWQSLDYS